MTGAYHRFPCGSPLAELVTFKRSHFQSIKLFSPSLLNLFLPSQPQASWRSVQVTWRPCQKGSNWCPNWHSQKTGQGMRLKYFPGQLKSILGQMWKTHKTLACIYISYSTARTMLLIGGNYSLLNNGFNKEYQVSLLCELWFSLELDSFACIYMYTSIWCSILCAGLMLYSIRK